MAIRSRNLLLLLPIVATVAGLFLKGFADQSKTLKLLREYFVENDRTGIFHSSSSVTFLEAEKLKQVNNKELVQSALQQQSFTINKTMESLRIVAFGTSKTWTRNGYVKMLSPTALNLGMIATQADYPALCLFSMIGEQVFDVIILEFCVFGGEHHRNFEQLAKRIRARFPSAVIIFLFMAMPFHDVLYQGNLLYDHIATLNLKSHDDPAFKEIIQNVSADLVQNPKHSKEDYIRTADSIGAFTVVFPYMYDNMEDLILKNARYFGNDHNPWDFMHPSFLGHQLAAEKIRQKLLEVFSERPLIVPPVLGEWVGGQDACFSWFTDTQLANEVQVTNMHLATGRMAGFERGEKWALEVGRTGGTLSIDCSKFPINNVYLSFMVYGPRRIYPRVTVLLNNNDTTFLDPYIERYHLRKTVFIGTVNSTEARANVTVIPIPEDANSTRGRFRITGIILTPFFAKVA